MSGSWFLLGPASDRIFVLQIARFVVLTGPAADEILELHFVSGKAHGLCWACQCNRILYSRLPSLWS